MKRIEECKEYLSSVTFSVVDTTSDYENDESFWERVYQFIQEEKSWKEEWKKDYQDETLSKEDFTTYMNRKPTLVFEELYRGKWRIISF